jgi:hypothetical protein
MTLSKRQFEQTACWYAPPAGSKKRLVLTDVFPLRNESIGELLLIFDTLSSLVLSVEVAPAGAACRLELLGLCKLEMICYAMATGISPALTFMSISIVTQWLHKPVHNLLPHVGMMSVTDDDSPSYFALASDSCLSSLFVTDGASAVDCLP